jgi:hypothetical protein
MVRSSFTGTERPKPASQRRRYKFHSLNNFELRGLRPV